MDRIISLIDAGIDFDAAMKRFHGNKDMYFKYLFRLPDDTLAQEAKAAFETEDYAKAESSIHTLKGVLSNLSVISLYDITCDILAKLRSGEKKAAKALFISSFLPTYANISEQIEIVRNDL